jgi:L-threonylcarbamoyladenylate synthase
MSKRLPSSRPRPSAVNHTLDQAVIALRAQQPAANVARWITAPFDAVRYGHDLYANLRALDAAGAERILVEAPPRSSPWEAVNDRLARAAASAVADDP